MNATEWTALVVAAIGAVGAVILQALQMFFTYKRATTIEKKVDSGLSKTAEVEAKIDDNTKITKEGTEAAASNASTAASAANQAASKAEELADQLDGKIESKITMIVKAHTEPLLAMFRAHIHQNDLNIKGIDSKFEEVTKYIHDRNHDMLDAMQTQKNQIAVLLELARQQGTKK